MSKIPSFEYTYRAFITEAFSINLALESRFHHLSHYHSYFFTGRTYADEMTDPWGNGSSATDRQFSMWVVYGAAAGGGGSPIPLMNHFDGGFLN